MTREEFNNRLKELKISIKEFSNIANTPYSTINNWGAKRDEDKIIPVPGWVESYLEHYEKSKKYDFLKREIFGVMKDLER